MSYMTPLSSIELSLDPTEDETMSGETVAIKKLPKWLLEFDSFTINETKFKNHSHTRPLTESSVGQRPQWFTEMAQQRRSSDTFASIDNKKDLFSFEKNSFSRSARRRSRRIDLEKDNDILEMNTKAEEFIETPVKQMDNKFETIYENKSFKNGFKSCENLYFESNENLEESNDFIIPELPFGQSLVFEIMSNWGDDDYIGLNGIEILDLTGKDLKIEKIWSEPRTESLDSLVDGIYRTHDDSHIWLTQLTAERRLPLKICINFERKISIALIRIWNYNKSRIYSYRGVKDMDIKLDNKLIFKGEIAKASGTLVAPVEAFGDTILFTTDEDILESVGMRDHSFQELVNDIIPLTQ